MADKSSISTQYVMILNIHKVVKEVVKPSTYSHPEETRKSESEVVKLVIRDPSIVNLIERGTKHLALVQDEETEVR